ncbi:MAG TPA: response regulator [Bacteroidales bacterium]|nr:response regulator [Bacteroidales bacterium]
MKFYKVVMFEDEFIPATDLAKKLEEIGYEVLEMFASAEKGLDYLEKMKGTESFPDAVLLDIALKGKLNGIEAARIITDQYGCGVVFLSALSMLSVIEDAIGERAYPFLFKPFDPYQVHIGLQMAVRISELEKEVRELSSR